MLGFLAVVAEWSDDLEFKSPLTRDEDIWDALREGGAIAVRARTLQMGKRLSNDLWLAVRSNSRLKRFERLT